MMSLRNLNLKEKEQKPSWRFIKKLCSTQESRREGLRVSWEAKGVGRYVVTLNRLEMAFAWSMLSRTGAGGG